ncbi:Serine/threonine-protein phosphatase 7 long form-like [Vitis vinifera]|uniref:Serine/threonine-protein phosphatase 7 long form-like n=1 Tax=Vitis vinifera TaxID=29760 RepID=A0A438DLD4_VITVI|nr:Serine/threonine-protein phosphatase 7 long form-like [Vitis vinifera]
MCCLPLLRDLTQTSMYSWDSAVLAHLYRELCQASLYGATNIVGCVTLLQVLWEPYMGDLVAHLPAISLVDQEIWRTLSPLICFEIVEWHRPDRAKCIATAPPMVGAMQFHNPYMEWYRRITRRLITPPLHRDQIRYHSTATTTQLLFARPTSGALGDIHRTAIDILHVIGEEHCIHSVLQSPTSSYPYMRPPVSATTVRMQPI